MGNAELHAYVGKLHWLSDTCLGFHDMEPITMGCPSGEKMISLTYCVKEDENSITKLAKQMQDKQFYTDFFDKHGHGLKKYFIPHTPKHNNCFLGQKGKNLSRNDFASTTI